MELTEKRLWFSFAIPLARLAEMDNHPSSIALSEAVGDRYLCRYSPVFASVRQSALEFGYRFSCEDTPLWRDYASISLASLQQILATGIVPYHDTGATFRRMVERDPKIALSPGFIVENLKHNYAFHEAAHCVAHSVMRGVKGDLKLIVPGERARFALEAVLAESFALSVETLGTLFRNMPMADSLFHNLNSYTSIGEEQKASLETAAGEMGIYARFRVLFLASFEATLSAHAPGEAVYERIAVAAGCDAAEAKTFRKVIDVGFDLNTSFRDKTTPGYFDFLGYKKEYLELAESGWLDREEHIQFVTELMGTLFMKATLPSG